MAGHRPFSDLTKDWSPERRARNEAVKAELAAETFDNAWEALCNTPGEVAVMTARSDLMHALRARVKDWSVSQDDAAVRLGITRARLSDLLRGKIDKFSLDALVNLTAAAGLHIEMRIADAA